MTTYGSIKNEVVLSDEQSDKESSPLLVGALATDTVSKDEKVSCMSKLLFSWFEPLLRLGNEKKRLDPKDLDLITFPDSCETNNVMESFDQYWQQEQSKKHPSLFRALSRAYGREFVEAGFLKIVHDLCVFVGPQVLNQMIFFLKDPQAPIRRGLMLTLAVTLSQLAMSFCLRHYFFKNYKVSLRTRTALVVAIYRKSLLLSSGERQVRTLGEITNFMSIDAQRLQDLIIYLHILWSSVLQISLALYFLWGQLGPSSLGGVAVILIMVPVTKSVAQWMGSMQKKLMEAKDARIELNGEVLGFMKVVKLQAWEESFQDRIQALRATELKKLFHYIVGNSLSTMLWTATPLVVALATFASYVLSGHQLEVASALTALALFDILRFPLFLFPRVVSSIMEASVSLKRIASFLMCEEHEPIGSSELNRNGVKMTNVSACYESKKPRTAGANMDEKTKELVEKDWEISLLRSQLEEAELKIREMNPDGNHRGPLQSLESMESTAASNLLCLKRIDFECKEGEFIAIVGGVGCGKSSFMNALLGELKNVSGTTSVKGEIAFFSQIPFILAGTVKDNIVFSHADEPFDEERYKRALDSCALKHDLALLPYGDMTEIGEKGITLSGGQKARLALARAVYHGADLSLIDDALSAVDAHVAKHLFQKCIVDELLGTRGRGTSTKRSVILCTNALQYLSHPRVDRIVVIRDGRIAEQGTYNDLADDPDSILSAFLSVLSETGTMNDAPELSCSPPSIEEAIKPSGEDSNADADVPASEPTEETPAKEEGKPASNLVGEEVRETGRVGAKVYLAWSRAAGGVWVPFVIVLAYASVEGVNVLSKWWLTFWSEHGSSGSQTQFLIVYAIINFGAAIVSFLQLLLIMMFGLRASRRLFAKLLESVLQAPMSFFDTTPVGRIVNRFSKDIYTIDEQLLYTLRSYLATLFNIISTMAVVSGIMPVFALCLVPLISFYLAQQRFFTMTYREVKRIDSVNRSPLYALLGESVDGVATIRAYGAQDTMLRRLVAMLDTQQHAYYLTCSAQCWLAIRLELVGTLIITFACLSAVLQHYIAGADTSFAGLAGLSISYTLNVTQSVNWTVRMASDFEANMVAVERIEQYCAIENEAPRKTPTDDTIQSSWPDGHIEFRGVKLRYRPGLPLVLKGLDIRIPEGSKVGVVGRTGAGKSTLMVALLRIVELDSGKIVIDGVDIRSVGLAKLRSKIAVIPQDPVLFSGTVRTNLDPFHQFEDEELYEVLSRVGLYTSQQPSTSSHSLSSFAQASIDDLSDQVFEGGNNFSVGQRQLLVIARALMCGASIVIMDEATAAVDAETDSRIQKVMRTEFANATCITVAHRLNTIMDSDYILVMDDGQAAEFDSPKALMLKGGMFRDLVDAAAQGNL